MKTLYFGMALGLKNKIIIEDKGMENVSINTQNSDISNRYRYSKF